MLRQGHTGEHIFIGGDSAGGGLAMSLLMALKQAEEPLPGGVVLLSPWLDLALRGDTLTSHDALDPLVSEAGLRHATQLYAGNHDLCNPLLSPIDGNLCGLPPLLIHVGDHEVLLSDSQRMAERAAAVGVEVDLQVWPEMWHCFPAWPGLPEAQAALEMIARFVQKQRNRLTTG
ncbi:MAG TPA: alpha/beta hydrolase fold domain-containing protein [Phototrophicaceae bacterium]|nr:alpha/beta hydrolase fold domain-containing protein [Phototrophicaceae bacterium]